MDLSTGRLAKVTLNDITLPITQDFLYYRGSLGNNNGEDNRASGAYVFRPVKDTTALPITEKAEIKIIKEGKDVMEIHQEFASWAKQIIRVYTNENHIEFDWLIGPIQDA